MACLHDHECEAHNCAADWSLYNHIDIPKVSSQSRLSNQIGPQASYWSDRLGFYTFLLRLLTVISPLFHDIQVVALNESVAGSVKSVFKPWEQRLDTSGVCPYP
jgi:hypothetical protein